MLAALAALALPGAAAAAPNDSTLQFLTLSAGSLNNPFDPSVTNYTANESAGQTDITVTPMATDIGATVTVNGASVAFSTASSPIALAVGSNTITIVVTSQDTSSTTTYTIDVTRAASANADLSNLVLSSGTLTPSFDPSLTSYTASVTTGTASVTITPTLSDTNATMTVNAAPATSGAAFGPVSLNYGTNTIGVQVTAQDGNTVQSYQVTITRPLPSGNPQTITFNNPGTQNFGTVPTLTATSDSGLTVSFSSGTTGVCTITSGGALTFVSAGTCTINADQAGNGTYAAAATVTQSFSVAPVIPGAPTIGTASEGDGQATVTFTAPGSNGGAVITGYTATSNPGGLSGTCANSPCTVAGLTNGTAYTFTVTATNAAGTGSASAATNSVTPASSQTITFANPGAQSYGTSPSLIATATSGLTVAFSSSTTGVCTITSGGVLTFVSAGTCTINADQAGNASFLAATTVSRSFAINAVVPGAPTIGTVTPGAGQVSVAFTAPASNGGAAITGYTVTSSPGGLTGTGSSSPIIVTGLTNGTSYTFTVTATNSAGTGPASSASSSATPTAPSTDAALSALTLSSGTLSPAFAAATTSYTASVANGTSSITVTPTANESHATVKVNGATVTSGSPSGALALAVGSNTVTVLVTAQDGTTTRSYTIAVTRAAAPPPPPPNVDLQELQVTTGDSPGSPVSLEVFSATRSYGRVGSTVAAVTVRATPPSGAHLTINGQGGSTPPGSAVSVVVPLDPDDNAITIVISAGSATKTYTVNIKRMVANNADLSAVRICSKGAGCSSPAFDPATTAYAIAAVGSFQIKPTAADSGAAVSVNGRSVSSGSFSEPFTAPATAITPVAVTVTSRDRTKTKTYTFTFSAPRPSADLSALAASAGTLEPAFDPATTSYTLWVPSDTSAVTLTPTPKDPAARTVMGDLQTRRGLSGPISVLSGSSRIVEVVVTATDQTTTTKYYVTIKQPVAPRLERQSGSDDGTVGARYEATFTAGSDPVTWTSTDLPPGLTLTTLAGSSLQRATLSGTPTKAGTYSYTLSATKVGTGGAAKDSHTYTLTVADAAPGPSPADLSKLLLYTIDRTPLALTPAFDPAVTAYTATTSAKALGPITANARDGATVQVIPPGGYDNGYPLARGANVFKFVVTKGNATKTYTVTVTQNPSGTDVNLKSLSLDGEPVWGFQPNTLFYAKTVANEVANIQVTAVTNDPTAKVTINGSNASSPVTLPLAVGKNEFYLQVSNAQNSLTKNYNIRVTRLAAAKLSKLEVSGVTLTPNVSPETTSYTASVSASTDTISIRAAGDAGTTLKMNGATVASDEYRTLPLSVGANTFKLEVTPEGGVTTQTYTLTVTREAPKITPVTIGLEPIEGQKFSSALSARGGKAPYKFELSRLPGTVDLPRGVTLASDGTVSGTPTEYGSFDLGVKVTDSEGFTGEGQVNVYVKPAYDYVVPTVQIPSLNGPSQTVLAVSDAALGTIEPHLASQVDISPFSSSAPAAAATSSGKSAGARMMASGDQAAASAGGATLLTYIPNPKSMGRDLIVVTGTLPDGTRGALGVEFLVRGTAPDLTARVAANGFATLDPTASVIGGPLMGLKILAPPAYGQVTVSGLQLIYTPDPAHLGDDVFVYAVDLGFGLSAPGTVRVAVGQAVVAPALSATTYAGQKVSLDLTATAQGGPFSGASVTAVSPSGAGVAQVRSTGAGTYALDFTPSTSFAGPATVTYRLTGSGGLAEADATITVQPRPDPSQDGDVRAIVSATDQAVKTFARSQLDNFNGRLESLRAGGGRGFDLRLGFLSPSAAEDPIQNFAWRKRGFAAQEQRDPIAAPAAERATDGPSSKPGAPPPPSPFGAWVGGNIQIGHVDGATRRRDYRLSTSGLSAGVDYRLSDHLVLGAGLGYGEDKAKVGSKGSRLDGESKVGAAYGSWLAGPGVFVDGVLGYGKLSFDVTRYSTESAKLLTGARSGDMTFGSLRAGFDRARGAWRVSPYGQLSFLEGRLDSFTESGDAAFALRFEGQDVRSLAGTLGLKLEGQRKIGRERTLSPRFRVEWRHEFDGVGDQVLSYADTAGSQRYVVPGDQLGRDEVSFELGGRLQLEHQLSLDLGYRGAVSDKLRSGAWSFRLDHSF